MKAYLSDRDDLLDMLARHAYAKGEFTLSSGKTSPYYLNVKQVLCRPKGLRLACRLTTQILYELGLFNDLGAFCGVAMGGVPLASTLAWLHMSHPLLIYRSHKREHGTFAQIEGVRNVVANGTVVLIDDVLTTGGSLVAACEALQKEGLAPSAALTVVDRQEGGESKLSEIGVRSIGIFTAKDVIDRAEALALEVDGCTKNS